VTLEISETTVVGDKRLQDAIQRFESHRDFPNIQVWMRTAVKAAEKRAPPKSRVFGSKARLKLVIHILNLQVVAYLPMVSDMATLKDFIAILRGWEIEAWKYYLGSSSSALLPTNVGSGNDSSPIHENIESWTTVAYQELSKLPKEETASLEDSAPEQSLDARKYKGVDPTARLRYALVEAHLEEAFRETGRKKTRRDIWKQAGYKTATEFQRFQRNDLEHVNEKANRRFMEILTNKPSLKKR
jgi:hypothetical protein